MKKVTIYSNTNCGACNAAKMFMHARGIEFVERNISEDPEAYKYLIEDLKVNSVPVLEVEGKEPLLGFSAPALLELVK